jgi:hypothetical protein
MTKAAQPLKEADVFDWVGRKFTQHMIEVAAIVEPMEEQFRAGGLMALEELYFRFSKKHFDWEEIKPAPKAAQPSAGAEWEKRERSLLSVVTYNQQLREKAEEASRELLEALDKIKRITAAGQLEERDIQCVYSIAQAAIADTREP